MPNPTRPPSGSLHGRLGKLRAERAARTRANMGGPPALPGVFSAAGFSPPRGLDPPGPSSAPLPPERLKEIAQAAEQRQKLLIPYQQTFASLYNAGMHTFYSRRDEALRDSWTNALAMRRDVFIHQLLRHRQLPVVSLPWHIDVDDPKDPEQKAAADRYTQLIEAIPRLQAMRLYLSEAIWYGMYASQIVLGRKNIDGRPGVTVTRHVPVQGDKLQWKWSGTPGVLIHSGWHPDEKTRSAIETTDRGLALFLYDPYWRERFIIHEFEPSDADWMFEGDLAGGVHGVGLRSRMYGVYQWRIECLSWFIDALQRIGSMGMLYGFYDSGNPQSEAEVITALKMLIRDNVTAFARTPGKEGAEIKQIQPSDVAYDQMYKLINDYFDEQIRLCVLGQSLTSEARPTGMNSAVPELHASTFEHIIRYDANALSETETSDLLGPLRKYNPVMYRGKLYRGDDIPFGMRVVRSVSQSDVAEKSQAIQLAYEIGLELDTDVVYEALGLTPPRDGATILKKPEMVSSTAGAPTAGGQLAEMGGRPGPGASGGRGQRLGGMVPTLGGANGAGGAARPQSPQSSNSANPAGRFTIARRPGGGGFHVRYAEGTRSNRIVVPRRAGDAA